MRNIAPAVREYGELAFPHPFVEIITSKNGVPVKLFLVRRGKEEVCNLTLNWQRGFADTSNLEAGVVMGKMLREGTSSFTADESETLLDFNGAWMNIAVQNTNTSLSVYSLSKSLVSLIPLIESIVTSPVFPEHRLEQVKITEADNLQLQERKVSFVANREIKKLMTGETNPFGKSIRSDKIFEINRHDLLRAQKEIIASTVPTVWLSGNFSDTTLKEVEKMIMRMEVLQEDYETRPMTPYIAEPCIRKHITVKDSLQTGVAIAFPLPGVDSKDFQRVRLAVTALGGYFGSRLNANIREEKGLTYGITASTHYSRDGAYCLITSQTTPENVEILIEETRKEICGFRGTVMPDEELIAVRRYSHSMLASVLESPFNLADMFRGLHLTGAPSGYLENYQSEIMNLGNKELGEVADRYFPSDNLMIITAG